MNVQMLLRFCIATAAGLTTAALAVLLCRRWWRLGAHDRHTTLDERNFLEITTLLQSLERSQIYHLGMVLGLSRQRMKAVVESKIDTVLFLDDVIYSWLKRENEVERRGIPSWETLVAALKHPRLRQNGIASDIEKQQFFGRAP